jgi:hypothetical protein
VMPMIQIINHTDQKITWHESDGVTHIFVGSAPELIQPDKTDFWQSLRYSGVVMLVIAAFIAVAYLMERVG